MPIKKILIVAPLLLIAILVQSYFWVPTYEEQTKGNPERLNEFITASIGDASMLNPILSADSASSDIEGKVFEGLLDRDENLRLRGRLATSWEIFEEAYFYFNKQADIPGIGQASAEKVVDLLLTAKKNSSSDQGALTQSLVNINEISIESAMEYTLSQKVKEEDKERDITLQVSAPPRIKLVLNKVDQELFANLESVLGRNYFSSFPAGEYVEIVDENVKVALDELAKSVLPAVEHNPIIIFHLRQGVQFHDGHLFDANDVKFTFDAIMDPKNLSPRVADYEPVKEVKVIDSHTVRIVYKRLYSPALPTWAMGILPEHLLNNEALKEEAEILNKDPESFSLRQSEFSRHPIGCGPFVFQEWKSDQYILLNRFDDYWEGKPNYKRYIYRIIPDPLTQEMEFYAGTIDNYSVPPHQVDRLKEDDRFQAFSGPSFGYTYIGYNLRRPPFDDPQVRRALGMAIDVNKIIRYVLYGQGERITGPFVKETEYYNHDIDSLPYDPDGALKLLATVGYQKNEDGWLEKDGKRLEFTLITNSGNDLRKDMLTIAQDAWKQIGVDVRTDLLEWSVFIQERVNKLDFDAIILGWSMGIEPDLYQIWHSSQTNLYQLNFVGFKNQEADDLIIKIRQEYDYERQLEFSHRLHEIIAKEQPYTFLYVGKWTAVLDKRIVLQERRATGEWIYKPIQPTKTGVYDFHFNKWIKLQQEPIISQDG